MVRANRCLNGVPGRSSVTPVSVWLTCIGHALKDDGRYHVSGTVGIGANVYNERGLIIIPRARPRIRATGWTLDQLAITIVIRIRVGRVDQRFRRPAYIPIADITQAVCNCKFIAGGIKRAVSMDPPIESEVGGRTELQVII